MTFPVTVDYTDLDFESLNARMANVLSSVFPTWTATQIANAGNALREMFAYVGDVLTFLMDNRAREAFISTAQLRESLLALVKLIGYVPAGAVAARVDVQVTQVGATGTVMIPSEQLVRTESVRTPVEFRLLGPMVIPAPTVPGGSSSNTGTAENSRSREDLFDSTGVADQRILLDSVPYLDGSSLVTAGDGLYEQVESLLSSTSTDRHYTVDVDEQDRAIIRFGSGTNGTIPVGTISVDYRTGGGAAGTVEAGTVKVIPGSFTDEFGNPVTVSVTNPNASTQGVDRASRDEIRVEAPESTRTQRRSVSREDFEIHAREVPGVGRALMLTSNELVGIAENSGQLYVLPVGGGVATQALLDAVEAKFVEKPPCVTFDLDVLTAPLLNVAVDTTVFFSVSFSPEVVAADIAANVATYFDPERNPKAEAAGERRVDFGFRFLEQNGDTEGKLPWSDVHDAVRDTTGVAKVEAGNGGLLINGVRDDLAVPLNQFPTLVSVTIRNARTGSVVLVQTYP